MKNKTLRNSMDQREGQTFKISSVVTFDIIIGSYVLGFQKDQYMWRNWTNFIFYTRSQLAFSK